MKLHVECDSKGLHQENSRFTYSAFKKLGRQCFFSREIRTQKDNSVAVRELHVETN